MSDRMAPFYCPYCGDENLRPSEAGHGAWECHCCIRVFKVTFMGLHMPQSPTREEVVP